MIHDPDHHFHYAPSKTEEFEAALSEAPPLHPTCRVACANCLMEYAFLPGSKCPRCGADPIFAVPRRDFISIPSAASAEPQEQQGRADEFGHTVLYIGIGLTLALAALGAFTNTWAFWLAEKFFETPHPQAGYWIQRLGVLIMLGFMFKGVASAFAWRSGRFWYRNFRRF